MDQAPVASPAVVAPVKQDIHAVKDLLNFIFTGGNVLKQANADGKINLLDLPLLMQLIPVAGTMMADINQVQVELKDIDASEESELVALFLADMGGISKPDLVLKISAGLEVAQSLTKLIKLL